MKPPQRTKALRGFGIHVGGPEESNRRPHAGQLSEIADARP